MTPTHAIFSQEGNRQVLKVFEMPEEPNIKDYGNNQIGLNMFFEAKKQYDIIVNQSIANAIEVKEQKDIEEIRIKWCESTGYNGHGIYQQKPELNKPYKLPDGLKFEIKEKEFGHVDDYSKPHGFKQYAFLIHEQKEETASERYY